MRQFWAALPFALLLGCANGALMPPGTISCQPYGYTPAPVAFSFASGPVTAAQAEETGVRLFRACELPGVRDLTSSTEPGTGRGGGPNAGQAVWIVKVDATVTDRAARATYQSHFWIEVNRATGAPTLIAYG